MDSRRVNKGCGLSLHAITFMCYDVFIQSNLQCIQFFTIMSIPCESDLAVALIDELV